MAGNRNILHAKEVKNDEFYTRYEDIEAEINAYYEYDHDVFRGKTILCPCDDHEWSNFTKYFAVNFQRFGLKKLICTSYCKSAGNKQTTLLEFDSPLYDKEKHDTHGKLFILTHDTDGSGVIDPNDVEFKGYLKGDGDFRSPEVCALRDEADVIVTNPPFSLFREFIAWIRESDKRFIVMANKNAITGKEFFPLMMENKVWVGYTSLNGGRWMILPKDAEYISKHARKEGDGTYVLNVSGVCWFTNIEHGKHYADLQLDTFENNLRYNQKLKKRLEEYACDTYPRYDNFDAIDVPYVECIPRDYDGVMGVPISFMDKYNPKQFEIIGMAKRGAGDPKLRSKVYTKEDYPNYSDLNSGPTIMVNGRLKIAFPRILIRRRL